MWRWKTLCSFWLWSILSSRSASSTCRKKRRSARLTHFHTSEGCPDVFLQGNSFGFFPFLVWPQTERVGSRCFHATPMGLSGFHRSIAFTLVPRISLLGLVCHSVARWSGAKYKLTIKPRWSSKNTAVSCCNWQVLSIPPKVVFQQIY